MTSEEFERYIKERYEDQLHWYDRKARRNKCVYNFFQLATIVFTAAAAILGIVDGDWQRWGAVGLSAFVSLGTSFLLAFRNQELWFRYRSTTETLKKEIHYYRAGIGEYGSSDDPMKLFVTRVEALISPQHTVWTTPPSNIQ